MELQRDHPPAYTHSSADLKLPSVPSHDVPVGQTSHHISLPDLRSLGLPESRNSTESWSHYRQNGQLNPSAFPSVPTAPPRGAVEQSLGSPMATESVLSSSDDRGMRAPSVMSMDDPDTRMAVEALSGLKNPDFMRSPTGRSTVTAGHTGLRSEPPNSPPQEEQEEPFLSLVTANHPWLGGTINGSMAAYNTTKYYSPAFVRNGAEFVERNIGSPLASTLRRTGVESGVRRYLGDRRPSDMETDDRRRKRLRETSPEKDVEKGMSSPPSLSEQHRSRAGSQASFISLPPYDENRSPRYEELASTALQDPATGEPLASPSRNWRTQLMITTSGLGAALSETSLKNLRYCLSLLRGASESITTMMVALKKLLDDYEESTSSADATLSNYTLTQEQEAASSRIADSIRAAHREIMKTLEQIKNAISRYAGAALPENAGALVRRQLMSIPQRWRVAESTAEEDASSQQRNSETAKAGKTIVVFASQSLDMLAQVTMVVGATIQNAEGWLARMGRRQDGGGGSALASPPPSFGGPVKDDRRVFETPIGFGDYKMREKS